MSESILHCSLCEHARETHHPGEYPFERTLFCTSASCACPGFFNAAHLRMLLAGASPKPWTRSSVLIHAGESVILSNFQPFVLERAETDAELIVTLRNNAEDILSAVETIDALRAQVRELEETIEEHRNSAIERGERD